MHSHLKDTTKALSSPRRPLINSALGENTLFPVLGTPFVIGTNVATVMVTTTAATTAGHEVACSMMFLQPMHNISQ